VIAGQRSITGLSASDNGRTLAFVATDFTHPSDVFVCDADGSNERQLTDFNAPWKAGVTLSSPERFTYERAGYSLDCWVMKPHGFQEGQRYPVLLNVHGGPATQYGHVFFDEFQVYAGAGYGVVFCNPRGSQGYGEEFMRAVLRRLATDVPTFDAEMLLAELEFLRESLAENKDRSAIHGFALKEWERLAEMAVAAIASTRAPMEKH